MKRLLAILLIAALCLPLCGCGKKQQADIQSTAAEPLQTVTPVVM